MNSQEFDKEANQTYDNEQLNFPLPANITQERNCTYQQKNSILNLQINQDRQNINNQSSYQNLIMNIMNKDDKNYQHVIRQNQAKEVMNRKKIIQQYYRFFKKPIPNIEDNFLKIPNNQELQKHKIKFLKGNDFYQKLQSYNKPYIIVKNTQRQSTIVKYAVFIAMFQLEITLLNIDGNATQQQIIIGEGSFGKVRIQSQSNRTFAVKRQMFQNKYHLKQFGMMANKYEVEQAIIQLAIYKICSLFKIGPAAETDIGFDLICYRDCIEFQIELCLRIQQNIYGIDVDQSKFQKQIKQCLFTLHQCRIIHKDIKPPNILYSRKYHKYVLADFGISHPVAQMIGYISKTGLAGTPGYMCKQMTKIVPGEMGYVHLYGNDVYSLLVVLKIKRNHKDINQLLIQFTINLQDKKKTYKSSNQYQYLKLKYYCIKLDSRMEQVESYWKYMDENRMQQLISIVAKSMQYEKIRSVYIYSTKSLDFQNFNLDILKQQSQSIKQIHLNHNIKSMTFIDLKNNLRIYGYNTFVKNIIINLKLQENFKETIKIIQIISDRDKEVNQKDRLFDIHTKYLKKVKIQLAKCEKDYDYQGMLKNFMIILKFANMNQQLDIIQRLKILKYERTKQEEIEQMIRVTCINHKKQQIQKFLNCMNKSDKEKDNIIKNKRLQSQIAQIYQQLGKYRIALKYMFNFLDIKKSQHNQIHPIISNCYSRIGNLYSQINKYQQSLNYYEKSLKIASIFGQQEQILKIYSNIGNVYYFMDQYDKAMSYYSKGLSYTLVFIGQKSFQAISVYNNISNLYYNIGKYQLALNYYQKILKIGILLCGQSDVIIARTYNNMANVYRSMGQHQKALNYYTKSLNIDKSHYGQQHPIVSIRYNNIGGIYDDLGNYEQALIYFKMSLDIEISFHGQQHMNVSRAYNNIARVYYHIGRYETALIYYIKCLDIEKLLKMRQSLITAKKYNNIGLCYLAIGNILLAQRFNYKSIKIMFNLSLDSSPQICANYYLLATIFFEKFKKIQSLEYAYLSLNIFLKFNSFDHPQLNTFFNLLAQIYYRINRISQSYFMYRLQYQILIKHLPTHHKNIKYCLQKIQEIQYTMPFLIQNDAINMNLIDQISDKYKNLSKYKLMKVLSVKKWQLKFEQCYRKDKRYQYLKSMVEIYFCYKYLGHTMKLKKIIRKMKQKLYPLHELQQYQIFQIFILKYDQ